MGRFPKSPFTRFRGHPEPPRLQPRLFAGWGSGAAEILLLGIRACTAAPATVRPWAGAAGAGLELGSRVVVAIDNNRNVQASGRSDSIVLVLVLVHPSERGPLRSRSGTGRTFSSK